MAGNESFILPEEIRKNLQTEFLGRDIHLFREVDSTNNVAQELASEGAEEGTIVIAESQRSGKGRWGKEWVSPEGGVWMTIILRPDVVPNRAPQLTLMTGVAVAQTLIQVYDLDVGIKWPNDILIGDKKVCGILTEVKTKNGKVDHVLVGIGIDLNVDIDFFPTELHGCTTSLQAELGREVDAVELIQRLLEIFEIQYNQFQEGNFRNILNQWRKLSSTIGSPVKIHKKGETIYGEAVGVNKHGKLIIELDDGTLRPIISGGVVHTSKNL
jgi:BirA family biotin operon repressor/biotin-[acetyl-CoA-carboxylase] ligase